MSELSDQLVVERLKKGDDSLFQKFYLEERKSFIQWCLKEYNLSTDESNDFYQEAQMYLYENIINGKLKHLTSSLRTYLYSIAKNQLRIRFKKMVVVQKHEKNLCEHLVFLKTSEGLDSKRKETVDTMARSVKQMAEPCKSLILLFYYENLSFKLIAKRLGYKNESVAKNQKKRCMERLRALLK